MDRLSLKCAGDFQISWSCYCQDDKEKLTEMIREIPFMYLCRDVRVGDLGFGGEQTNHSQSEFVFCPAFCQVILV